ncbi:Phosphatidylglycerophosphatase A [Limosilactobacillus gastricus PS3]|uniref:Phosphatidylglycerophosphatase A n=2 Tax=Limosilactobacillus gastricus TaxID=227942 RepID=H4GIZ7_9LACO|nr:phosphatidylglycerophosphatase A [Limosilactobacillus gastricus]EHS87109.1 Phosphatidylglycerophosphatase A [Limosilactobacillus gastricus PS3]KRM00096.1 Phosphatidylglycerophosphatase A [Limosilactobacillus gastricus DSM 16045]QGF40373.1 phosphatidylglycerophosphatase A [Limosilactobacillus gastricus]
MFNPNFKYPDTEAYNFVVNRLHERGVELHQLSDIAFEMQSQFGEHSSREEYYENLIDVLHKRELLNEAMVALELDRLAQENQIQEPLLSIIKNDSGVFGVDEALAIQISNIYGTIGTTNFGYLDRVKYGIIKKFDQDDQHVATFIDDLLGAIIAALCGKMAHLYA